MFDFVDIMEWECITFYVYVFVVLNELGKLYLCPNNRYLKPEWSGKEPHLKQTISGSSFSGRGGASSSFINPMVIEVRVAHVAASSTIPN